MEKEIHFVLCIKNENCEDLEVCKIYQVLPDESAEKDNYLRIIDESGEDYLYPANLFYPIKLTKSIEEYLLQAA